MTRDWRRPASACTMLFVPGIEGPARYAPETWRRRPSPTRGDRRIHAGCVRRRDVAGPRRLAGRRRALHLAGLLVLPAGRRVSRRDDDARRHHPARLPRRLLELYRLDRSLRLQADDASPEGLFARPRPALHLYPRDGG